MEYNSEVRRRFRAPARACDLPENAGTIVTGAAEDRSLNVWVKFEVEVSGCPHTLAAADIIAEALEGGPLEGLERIDTEAVARRIDLPREKHGVLLRMEDALSVCYRRAVEEERA